MRAFEGMAWLAVLIGGQGTRVALSRRRLVVSASAACMVVVVLGLDDVIGLQGAKEICFLVGLALVAVVVTERTT